MFKKINHFIICCALGLSVSSPVAANVTGNITEDFQTWGNITALGSFAPINPNNPDLKKFRYWMEGQGRFGDNSSQFSQSLIRPGLGYNVTDKLSLWVGYAYVPTSGPFAGSGSYTENRIWQQALWADNFWFGRLTARFRVEQRFFDHNAPSSSETNRVRQMLKLATPITFISPNLSFILMDELFINSSASNRESFIAQGFDQNRGFVGLAYKWNPIVTTEVGYMNLLYNRPLSARPDQMMHILGINLFLNFQ